MMAKRTQILFIGDRESFFSREVLRGVFSMRSEGADWNYWCLSSELSIEELNACLNSRKVDGILARGLDREMANVLREREVPCVFIRAAEDESVEYINGPHPDDQAIGRLAGEEFGYLNLGYWGFVHWEGVMWSEARKQTFHSYATALGVSNETLALPPDARTNWAGVQKIAEWLDGLPKPCGVLACKDEAGLDVLQACNLLGLSVPDEVAVIGVDNDRLLCESTSPALTSIDLKAADLGRAAVVQLGKMLDLFPEHHGFAKASAVLVARESSHRKDRYSIIYQRALDYIEARPLANTSVSTLAKSCGVSRRGLERAFEKCVESSPAIVMRERRMHAIEDLLKDSNATLESIAHQSGFSEPAGLSNFVKRMTGKTPGKLRED